MRLLDQHIRHTILASTVMVVLVLIGLETFMEFVGQLSFIGDGHFGILQAMLFVPMQLPADVYQLFPMAGLLGCLIGLGRLASTSELIIFQSAGVSVARITWSVIKAALLMIIAITLLGEMLGPVLQNKGMDFRERAIGHPIKKHLLKGIWLHQDNAFVHIGKVSSAKHIKNIVIYRFNQNNQLQSAETAKDGFLQAGHWQLQGIARTIFHDQSVQALQLTNDQLNINIKPTELEKSKKSAYRETLIELVRNIFYRQQAGLVTSQFELALWQRLLKPLTTIMMICLGIPFIFGSLRSATMGSRILTGIIVGFGFYMLNQFFGPITMVYQFPPWLAALLPTFVVGGVYLLMMRKIK